MYVIHKQGQEPGYESYSGGAWDFAELRDERKPQYAILAEAEGHAIKLNKTQGWGKFTVSEAGAIKEKRQPKRELPLYPHQRKALAEFDKALNKR